MKLEFFFDVVSPYSYLAAFQVEALVKPYTTDLIWRPFFLGGVMKASGNQPPGMIPAKGRYMLKDLARQARLMDLPFAFPTVFPANTLLAQRALTSLPQASIPDAARALFSAYWGQGQDISQPSVVADILGETSVAQGQTDGAKAALQATTEEAVKRGAFGAPTFFLSQEILGEETSGDDMFFGNDRLPLIELYLRRAAS